MEQLDSDDTDTVLELVEGPWDQIADGGWREGADFEPDRDAMRASMRNALETFGGIEKHHQNLHAQLREAKRRQDLPEIGRISTQMMALRDIGRFMLRNGASSRCESVRGARRLLTNRRRKNHAGPTQMFRRRREE